MTMANLAQPEQQQKLEWLDRGTFSVLLDKEATEGKLTVGPTPHWPNVTCCRQSSRSIPGMSPARHLVASRIEHQIEQVGHAERQCQGRRLGPVANW
jgi:hypothetical protein